MKKKIPALLLAAVMVMSLAACGGNDSGNTADPGPSADPAAPAEKPDALHRLLGGLRGKRK